MTSEPRARPPLSPILIAGLGLRPLPSSLLESLLSRALAILLARHPELAERLSSLEGAEILIDPSDLPLAILMRVDDQGPWLTCLREDASPDEADRDPDAAVRAPLALLVELLEGRLDGDAVFFSRALTIEGDTEVVLTLRNALESAEIDLIEDLSTLFGPLAPPVRRTAKGLSALFRRAAADLESLRAAVVAPVEEEHQRQAARLRALEAELEDLRRRSRRGGPRAGREVGWEAPEP